MSRWVVIRDRVLGRGSLSEPWAAYSYPPGPFRTATFPTWRQAYAHALTRARQEAAHSDWTPDPATSGRDPASATRLDDTTI